MNRMDIHFTDLSEVPLPPKEVRIREFVAEPYPDGKRLRLSLDLTPFQKSPSCEIFVTDLLGNLVATANIIGIIDPKMQLTMHLRIRDPQGTFTARALIFYTESLDEIAEGDQIAGPPARQIVDEKEITFFLEE
jgi:hypothetical protein